MTRTVGEVRPGAARRGMLRAFLITLKPSMLGGLLVVGGLASSITAPAHGQETPDLLTIDQLLSIGSVISGSPAWSPDGERILLTSSVTGGLATLPSEGGFPTLVPLNTGGGGHFLASQMPGWSPSGRWISYVSDKSGAPEIWLWSTEDGNEVQLTDLGARINSMSWSPDGREIAFTLTTITRPPDLYVALAETGETRQLTNSMPAGNFEERLVVPEKVRYGSTDGYDISAYLYAPPGLEAGERVPAILWIHGGPTGQYHDTFQQHVQFFVQRGYAVLLPNIRGSAGYGKEFENGNNGCWGHCDLEDVVAGVEYLKGLSYVDPSKMGITGTSYGGIMSMYAVAFAPDVFQAAIPGSGYSDWVHFYNGENELRHIKLLEYELGPFATSEDVWAHSSAIDGVADVSTPILLVHGVGRYPGSDQSEIFANALENHYKPFRYETYEGETYYVRGKTNRRQMLLDMLDFFDQFLKDGVVTNVRRVTSSR